MTRRVVITGMGGVTAFGENWQDVSARLLAYENAVRKMPEWQVYDGLHTLLGAPVDDFTLPEHYTRKRIRAMGRVSQMSTRASELALEQAGLIGDPILTSGETGIAYGSSTGSTGPGKRVRHHADGKAHEQHHWHHLCADDAAHYCR